MFLQNLVAIGRTVAELCYCKLSIFNMAAVRHVGFVVHMRRNTHEVLYMVFITVQNLVGLGYSSFHQCNVPTRAFDLCASWRICNSGYDIYRTTLNYHKSFVWAHYQSQFTVAYHTPELCICF